MSLAQQYAAAPSWLPTHVQVTVLQARGLRAKGKSGTNDAYAIIQLGKERYSTTVAEKSRAPLWKEEATFELPLLHQEHRGRGTLRVTVQHRALVGLDKHLGEVALDLYQLQQDKARKKTRWYKLQSKPGKKEKERGDVEIDIEFMRNNMTASMFDLSMKDKSRSPFGKLKDKMKGKRNDGFPDTASAIVPSFSQAGADSDEEAPEKGTKKKSKLKNFFSKPGLQKSSLSQSMSVLPSFQPAPPPVERTVLKPRDFSSDFNEVPLSTDEPASNKAEGKQSNFPVVMTHKRTVSADPNQINQIVSGNTKKEGLSFFSGLRSKNDPITRSNLCINGNHVYDEEKEPKGDAMPKDTTLSFTPKVLRKTPMYSSIENLSTKSSSSESLSSKNTKEPGEPAHVLPDQRSSWSLSKDSLKSMTLPSYKPSSAEESRESTSVGTSDPAKETKDTKKPESLKSSLLSLVTGKKDAAKGGEGESASQVPVKEKAKPADVPLPHPVTPPAEVPSRNQALNPFEEDLKEEDKMPELPPPSTRVPKTTAVKPRLDVSSEAETKAELNSSALNDPPLFPSSHLSCYQDYSASVPVVSAWNNTPNAESCATLGASLSDPDASLNLSFVESQPFPTGAQTTAENASCSLGLRSHGYSLPASDPTATSSRRVPEAKEVQVVTPFGEKASSSKTSVKSLLDQLKGKKPGLSVHQFASAEQLVSEGLTPNPKTEILPEGRQELVSGNGVAGSPDSVSPKETREHLYLAEGRSSHPGKDMVFAKRGMEQSVSARERDSTVASSEETTVLEGHVETSSVVFTPSGIALKERSKPYSPAKELRLKVEDAENRAHINVAHGQPASRDLAQKDPPRPKPRAQAVPPKVTDMGDSDLELQVAPAPPKPAPRSATKLNLHIPESNSTLVGPMQGPAPPQRVHEDLFADRSSFAQYNPSPRGEQENHSESEIKMASPAYGDLKFRLDELPVIHEHSELMSDEEPVPVQVRTPAQEPSKAAVSARNVPSSAAEKQTAPTKTAAEQRPSQQPKEVLFDPMPESQLDAFNSSISPNQMVTVESDKRATFPDQQDPKYDHVQESSAFSDVSDRTVNSLQVAGSPTPDDSLSLASALHSSVSLQSNPSSSKKADSQTRPPAEGSDRAEVAGKKKLLRAWVSPSETPPFQAPPSAAVPAQLRPHPVKPMSSTQVKAPTSFGAALKNQENYSEGKVKKYDPSDPASGYAQLTHDELIQVVLKQKETIVKKESQVQELEEYIDNLLVRVMEETPNILGSLSQMGKKAGKV